LNGLDHVQAVLLGIVQGLTEFLPVSSSAHLVFAQKIMGLDPSCTEILFFDMLTHVGTLAAMTVVFAPALKSYGRRLWRELSGGPTLRRIAWRFAWLGIVASIPTAAIGLLFKDFFEASFNRPRQTGIELMITGMMLAAMIRVPRGRRGWSAFRNWHAFLIGTAQALSILPGISRSGATIFTACLCGLRRRWAADFSFLIAAPAIVGATVIKWKDALDLPVETSRELAWSPILVGTLASFAVGVLALRMLLRTVQRSRLHLFAPYCLIVGLLAVVGFFGQRAGVSVP